MDLLLADTRPFFDTCPRCGGMGLEKLRTHSHCVECNYFETPRSGSMESLLVNLNHEVEQIEARTEQTQNQQHEEPKNNEAA